MDFNTLCDLVIPEMAMQTNLHSDSKAKDKKIILNDEGLRIDMRLIKSKKNYSIGWSMAHMSKYTNYWNMHIHMRDNYLHTGYGPLLYDIIMEYVTHYKKSILVPSVANNQGGTSDFASNVYKYYFYKRPDVVKYENLIDIPDKIYDWRNGEEVELSKEEYPWLFCGYSKELDHIPRLLSTNSLVIQ